MPFKKISSAYKLTQQTTVFYAINFFGYGLFKKFLWIRSSCGFVKTLEQKNENIAPPSDICVWAALRRCEEQRCMFRPTGQARLIEKRNRNFSDTGSFRNRTETIQRTRRGGSFRKPNRNHSEN